MAEDLTAKLQGIKDKAQQADRERAAAEARLAEAQKRLKEIDEQIKVHGVKPEEAEAHVAALEVQLAKDIATINETLDTELAAYRALVALGA